MTFEQLIEELYSGALDNAAWYRALAALSDDLRASAALLLAVNPLTGEVLRHENIRADPSGLEAYARDWTYQDPRRVPFQAAAVGAPMTEMTLRIPNWRRTAFLNEFLLPFDSPHFMPVWLHKTPTKMVALSMQGTRKRGAFDDKDIAYLKRISPHISRALAIRDRLESVQVRADSLAISLNTLSFGVALLDEGGRLLEANAIAQTLLRSDRGIRLRPDRTLWLREPAGSRLDEWLSTGTPPHDASEGLLHVPQSVGPPLSILVSHLPIKSLTWVSSGPRWLVLVFDPERQIQGSREIIAKDLSISASEAEVVSLLVAGHSLREAAIRLHVSEHTVRAQLKSVFRKTGTHSQTELVRRVAMGAAASSPVHTHRAIE